MKGTKLFPNTRGVRETFDTLFSRLEEARRDELTRIGLDRSMARYYFDAKTRYEDEIYVPDPPEERCEFYFGCPTGTLSSGARESLSREGIIAWQLDHIRPASTGGARLQPMCAVHNHLKADSLLWQPDTFWVPLTAGAEVWNED